VWGVRYGQIGHCAHYGNFLNILDTTPPSCNTHGMDEETPRPEGTKMNAQDILVQKIKDTSDAFQRGEITHEEANETIAIFANALRSVKS